jgi:hypothetical protein
MLIFGISKHKPVLVHTMQAKRGVEIYIQSFSISANDRG